MSKKYIMSIDSIKTFCQGALGAMTFGAYHQYTTNKMIELNNETQNLKQQTFINSMKLQHIQEMESTKKEIQNLKQQTFINSMKLQHIQEMESTKKEMEIYKKEMDELKNKLNEIEHQKNWW